MARTGVVPINMYALVNAGGYVVKVDWTKGLCIDYAMSILAGHTPSIPEGRARLWRKIKRRRKVRVERVCVSER